MNQLWSGLGKITRSLAQTSIHQSYQPTLYQPSLLTTALAKTITGTLFQNSRNIFVQACLMRARKGTRERKFKALQKKKAQKAGERIRNKINFMKLQAKMMMAENKSKRVNDSMRENSPDNVWFTDMFKLRKFSFEEAVKVHREVHHPSLFNEENALLHAYIELDMSTDKKTKFFDGFSNVVSVKYPYDHKEDRSILVFCREREQMDVCLEAGAALAGGTEVITSVKRGRITLPDFHFVLAHPNVMNEVLAIRGLLRQKYPDIEKGTLTRDLVGMINSIRKGIKYEAKRDEFETSYGWINVPLGPLNGNIEHLQDNLTSILEDVRTRGPRRLKDDDYRFMTRCYITTSLHNEKLLIPMEDYVSEEIEYSSDEDEEEAATTSDPTQSVGSLNI